MYITKCPVCCSSHTMKNGRRNNVQLYRCRDCGHQFRHRKFPTDAMLWYQYQEHKQTILELSEMYGVSPSTIKRRLRNVVMEWQQPQLEGQSGFVHLDATYWGHNWGVLAAIDTLTGEPLYLEFIKNETTLDYVEAVRSIESRGYSIRGLIIDGKPSLFKAFSGYKIQMCQFHMKEIVKRYLTKNPRLKAARALSDLMKTLTTATKLQFETDFKNWQEQWKDTLSRKSLLKSGKMQFTHRRLRSAMNSIVTYLPYLFTYQLPECQGMPNTNNKIEGTFTDLKRNMNNHSGMTKENRKRFIIGFFLALRQ